MTSNRSIVLAVARYLLLDLVGDLLYWPIWWYTVGLKSMLVKRRQALWEMSEILALRLLVLNIFQPMYAQYDREGRIISFFIRIIILLFRGIIFLFFVLLQIVILIVWIVLPVIIVWRLGAVMFDYYV